MRKVLSAVLLLCSSVAVVHCAGSPPAAGDDAKTKPDTNVVEEKKDASPAARPPPSIVDAASPLPVADADPDSARPAPPADAAPPLPPETPGPACTALSDCCGKLTNSISAAGCYVIVGKKNELLCGGGFATFDCANAGSVATLGPSCAQLSACCNSNTWIRDDDPQCKGGLLGTPDWKSGNEDVCAADLNYYENDPYGDCL
jgi:hypothetical protein